MVTTRRKPIAWGRKGRQNERQVTIRLDEPTLVYFLLMLSAAWCF